MSLEAQTIEQINKWINKKAVIFEEAQQAQVNAQAQYQVQFPSAFIICVVDGLSEEKIHYWTQYNQTQKSYIPCSVKDVAGKHNERILSSQTVL